MAALAPGSRADAMRLKVDVNFMKVRHHFAPFIYSLTRMTFFRNAKPFAVVLCAVI